MDDRFELTQRGSQLELFDRELLQLVARLDRIDDPPDAGLPSPSPSGWALIQLIAEQFPVAQQWLQSAGQVRVVFSPESQLALANHSYRLMRAQKGLLPVVVDSSGRIREIGAIVSGAGGLVTGAALAPLLPVLVPTAIAAAACVAQQRWLEQTLDRIEKAVERIEERLRDDDRGTLAAAMSLTRVLQMGGTLPDYLRLEIALARRDVERIFASRGVFVDRVLDIIATEQRKAQQPWTRDIISVFASAEKRAEISIFLTSLVARAHVGAGAAAYLVQDGEAEMALNLVNSIETSTRSAYERLYTGVRDLAKYSPQDDGSGIGPMKWGGNHDRAFKAAKDLDDRLTKNVGSALPARSAEASLLVAWSE